MAQRSASKSKSACSFFNSQDGNYYKTQAVLTASGFTGLDCTGLFPPEDGYSETYTASENFEQTVTSTYGTGCTVANSCSGTSNEAYSSVVTAPDAPDDDDSCTWSGTANADCSGWTGSGSDSSGPVVRGGCLVDLPCPLVGSFHTTTTTYSELYTDAELMAVTVAALPAWPALTDRGLATSGTELASAELGGGTYSILESKYQLAHTPSPTGIYRLTWVERFVPDGGVPINSITLIKPSSGHAVSATIAVTITGDGTGATAEATTDATGTITAVMLTSPGTGYTDAAASIPGLQLSLGTETARSYTWDGTTPSGYNPSDNATWPRTPTIYEVDQPSSNGIVTLANLVVSCTPS